jgi:hypothetical protein
LAERLVRARLVYEQPTMNRAISFDYMNRELARCQTMTIIITALRNNMNHNTHHNHDHNNSNNHNKAADHEPSYILL